MRKAPVVAFRLQHLQPTTEPIQPPIQVKGALLDAVLWRSVYGAIMKGNKRERFHFGFLV